MTDEKMYEIMGEMDEVNRELDAAWDEKHPPPLCHMKPMFYDDDGGDGFGNTQAWWECSVCGHTKEIDYAKIN